MKFSKLLKTKIICVPLSIFALFVSIQLTTFLNYHSRVYASSQQTYPTTDTSFYWYIRDGVLHVELFNKTSNFTNCPWSARISEIRKIRITGGYECIRHIDSRAFYGYKNLKTLDMFDCKNLESIAQSAFKGCEQLELIVFPQKFESKFYSPKKDKQECRKYYGINSKCEVYFLEENTVESRVKLMKELDEYRRELQRISSLLNNKSNNASEVAKLSQNVILLTNKIDKLSQRLNLLEERVNSADSRISKNSEEIEKMKQMYASAKEASSKHIAQLEQKITNLQNTATTFLSADKGKNAELKKIAANLQKEVDELKKLKQELNSKISVNPTNSANIGIAYQEIYLVEEKITITENLAELHKKVAVLKQNGGNEQSAEIKNLNQAINILESNRSNLNSPSVYYFEFHQFEPMHPGPYRGGPPHWEVPGHDPHHDPHFHPHPWHHPGPPPGGHHHPGHRPPHHPHHPHHPGFPPH